MKGAVSILIMLALAGCASGGGALPPPAARFMVPPPPLSDKTEGDDLVPEHKVLRRSYSQCTSRLKGLQRYVRKATK